MPLNTPEQIAAVESQRQAILKAREEGPLALAKTFVRFSGPGWLQGAITLGGGSLSSALYLGVLAGFGFLWLQPLAMLLGVVMLSAIAYVTLTTGERPLVAINTHISPVLGWSWLGAAMLANMVWSMPQFSLATAALQQNLVPAILGPGAMPDPTGKIVTGLLVLVVAIAVVALYNSGSVRGVRLFELITKFLVAMVVLCFIGVVLKLAASGGLDGTGLWSGFIPRFGLWSTPSELLAPLIAATDPTGQVFWTELIVGQQREVIIGAIANAVGINMTFLMPYSLLRKGWDKEFRGLAMADLGMGLLVPFILATTCVVVAAAARFHAEPAPGFLGERDGNGALVAPDPALARSYTGLLQSRLRNEIGGEAFGQLGAPERAEQIAAMPESERRLAAVLVRRDALHLAGALEPLTGSTIANTVFGLGVLGMALSTIVILMLIGGMCLSELLGRPSRGTSQWIGALLVSVGVVGPVFWNDAKLWLAMPTSAFGMTLLPIAYIAFFALINNRAVLGDDRPAGLKRIAGNILMIVATCAAAVSSLWVLWSTLGWKGIGIFVVFTGLVLATRRRPRNTLGAAT